MFTPQRHENRERGFISTASNLLGAVIGGIILAAFVAFWVSANTSSQIGATRASQERDAVAVLNRAGRDITQADAVTKDDPTDLVVEQRSVTGTGATKTTTITRTRYSVVTQGGVKVLQRQVDLGASAGYSDATFTPDVTNVLARRLTAETQFAYVQADGTPTTDPAKVGRVDITYVASTQKGLVTLKSSAALDTALGGTGGSGSAPPVGPPPAGPTSATPAAVSFNDPCGTGSDSYTIPSTTGVDYQIAGVTRAAGTYAGSGTVNVTAVAQPGYTLSGTTSWSHAFDATACAATPATPAAVSFNDPCGTGSDSYTIPSTTGVDYQIAGVTRTAGTYPGSATVSVTAVAQPGYTLTGTTSWSQTFTNAACAGGTVSVDAYPSAAPSTANASTGANTVTWSDNGSSGPFTVAYSANGGTTWTTLSANATSPYTHASVPLGTRYLYRVTPSTGSAGTDPATQFPLTPTIKAEGSDWNRDGTPDHTGANAVDWTVDLTTTYTQVRAYTSRKDTFSNLGVLGSYTTIENPTQATTTCPGTANTGGNCYLDTGESAGTEKIYAAIAYTDCDYPGAQVTAGGAARCPSGNYYTLGVNAASDYAAMTADRAYQAPGVTASSITAGNPTGDACTATDESGATVRLVRDFADTANNGIYSCSTGTATIGFTTNPDDGQSAIGGGPFCDYSSTAADCQGKAVRGDGQTIAGTKGARSDQVTVPQTDWASTDTYKVYSCNLGGCAAPATTTLESFAGAFNIDDVQQPPTDREFRYNHWYPGTEAGGDCYASNYDVSNCAMAHSDELKVIWSKSPNGVASGGTYTFDGAYVAGPGTSTTAWSNRSVGTNVSTGWLNAIDAATVYKFSVLMTPGNDPRMWRRSTNGALNSPNPDVVGTRYWDYVYTAPLHVSLVQDSGFCKGTIDNDWKYGVWFRRSVYDYGGTRRNSLGLNFRYMWWAARAASSTNPDQVGDWAASKWRTGTVDPGTWALPGTWVNTTSASDTTGTQYYANASGLPTDAGWTKILTGGSGTAGADNNVIPGDGGTNAGMAHFRIETYIYKSALATNLSLAQPVDQGDTTYWVGTGANDNGVADSGGSMQSVDIRSRAVNVTKAVNTACTSDGSAINAFVSGSAWFTTAGGYQVSRRASIGGESSAAKGPNTNPNPDKPNGARWNEVN